MEELTACTMCALFANETTMAVMIAIMVQPNGWHTEFPVCEPCGNMLQDAMNGGLN